jgi:hypothetical protein
MVVVVVSVLRMIMTLERWVLCYVDEYRECGVPRGVILMETERVYPLCCRIRRPRSTDYCNNNPARFAAAAASATVRKISITKQYHRNSVYTIYMYTDIS